MSGTATAALDVARHWLGYTESPTNITPFGEWYGMNGVPWCAEFVSYCTYTSGTPCPATTPKGFAYCPSGIDWFKAQKRWFASPEVGDLVFYDWNGDGVSDHVGIVEALQDGGVTAIEGNENNAVTRIQRFAAIMGYGRPAYAGSPPPPAPNLPPPPAHPHWPGRYLTLTTPYTDGTDVHEVQGRLEHYRIGAGATLVGYGPFGPKTYQAVCDYQEHAGIKVDGIVGPITWDALWR